MKDPIQHSSEEVAIVIYDSPLPPRYYRVTKKFLKTLLVTAPILLVFTMAALLTWGLGTRVIKSPRPELPSVLTGEASKTAGLEEEIRILKESNNDLTLKLSDRPSTITAEDPYLMAIKKPYGMQNFLNENRVALDQFQLVHEPQKTSLKFQITSSKPETKVTGHIIVFMISNNGVMSYPKETNSSFAQGIKYSAGEPFAVSRLRPTNAEFNTQVSGDTVKFMIYIFSREGDLILIRETESFKIGNP